MITVKTLLHPSFCISRYSSISAKKNLIYVGPVNQMVRRMKMFSIGSALTSSALAPTLIYFSADHWSLFAKFGLVSTVLFTSYGLSYLFHLLIKKYVFTIYKGIPEVSKTEENPSSSSISGSFDHLLIEKLSFWGRRRISSVPLKDLINGASIFNTWKSSKTGEGFLLQFNEEGNNVVTSFNGEPVDYETMKRIYNEIFTRR